METKEPSEPWSEYNPDDVHFRLVRYDHHAKSFDPVRFVAFPSHATILDFKARRAPSAVF